VHASDSVVDHPNVIGQCRGVRQQPTRDFGAEAVVAQEDVADAGNQNRWCQG